MMNRNFVPPIDTPSRIFILTASFFAIAALTLCIVGTVTRSWYDKTETNGSFVNYNLFTYCSGNRNISTSICYDMPRQDEFGVATQNASAFLVVAICFLGCGMIVILAMNFVRLMGILVFIGPILLFLASLFLLATFAEASRVMIFNGYSIHLVQTAHMATIFALSLIAFVSGRLHVRYYQQF